MDYNGPRTKQGMLNWLLKRTREPLTQINAEQYEALASQSGVSIVYHGDIATSEQAETLKSLAIADDYNSKFVIMKLSTMEPIWETSNKEPLKL